MSKDDIIMYFRSSFEELKKVNWPSRQVTQSGTLEVIILSLALAGFIGGIDYLFNVILALALDI